MIHASPDEVRPAGLGCVWPEVLAARGRSLGELAGRGNKHAGPRIEMRVHARGAQRRLVRGAENNLRALFASLAGSGGRAGGDLFLRRHRRLDLTGL